MTKIKYTHKVVGEGSLYLEEGMYTISELKERIATMERSSNQLRDSMKKVMESLDGNN